MMIQLVATFVLFTSSILREVSVGVISRSDKKSIYTPSYVGLGRQGARLAVEDYQKRLKQKGLRVVAKDYFVDDDSLSAYRETKKAIVDPQNLLAIGLQASNDAGVAAEAVYGSNFLLLSVLATSTHLRKYSPNLVLMSPTNDVEARAIEQWLSTKKSVQKIAAVINWDNQYSQNMYQNFSKRFRERLQLFKVISESNHPEPWVQSVVSASPDTIILPSFPVPAATAIQRLVAAGFNGHFVAGGTWGDSTDQRFSEILRETHYQGWIIRPYSILKSSPKEEKFKKRLSRITSEAYTPIAALYYDTMALALETIFKLGANVDRHQVKQAIEKKRSFQGILGTYCLTAEGCPPREFKVLHIKDNQVSYLNSLAVQ